LDSGWYFLVCRAADAEDEMLYYLECRLRL
jgi:hypothetical protein